MQARLEYAMDQSIVTSRLEMMAAELQSVKEEKIQIIVSMTAERESLEQQFKVH